ncbi:sugar phosphate isomerase/epimerase family protein [Ktedonospora formicarum]|uniref:Endonuclease n=1 Tax=Ktedonospora formicarum TaxID=2778364 RepID=A0A8J3I009_9CHLR|nr:sugar phosphate isomerase/epimerase family protein [Ktedonospora formicarum]GHO47417.1 endonuclease [Ktedonospora formicarum]
MMTTSWPQVGIFTYDFTTLPALIHFCQRHRLSCVQLGGPLLEQAVADTAFAVEMRQQLQSHNIKITALAGYRNLVVPNEVKRMTNLTFLKECLRLAPLLGTPIVATETGTYSNESDWLASSVNQSVEVRERLYVTLEKLLRTAEQYGSVLALEGYVNNVIHTVDALEEVLVHFATPHLQVVLDPFNYLSRDLLPQSEQVVCDFLARFEQHFTLAHLKDVSADGAEVDTPEFGYGVFPFRPYFTFLKHRRPDLPLILEHLPMEHLSSALMRLHTQIQALA